jgi:hypothetical protein
MLRTRYGSSRDPSPESIATVDDRLEHPIYLLKVADPSRACIGAGLVIYLVCSNHSSINGIEEVAMDGPRGVRPFFFARRY